MKLLLLHFLKKGIHSPQHRSKNQGSFKYICLHYRAFLGLAGSRFTFHGDRRQHLTIYQTIEGEIYAQLATFSLLAKLKIKLNPIKSLLCDYKSMKLHRQEYLQKDRKMAQTSRRV